MGYEFNLADLRDKYLYKLGRLDRDKRDEVCQKLEELLNNFKRGDIPLDMSSNELLELSFFTALKAIGDNVSSSYLRKIYFEIMNIKKTFEEFDSKNGDLKDILASINKARATLAYLHGRVESSDKRGYNEGPSLYDVLEEALRKVAETIEKSIEDAVGSRDKCDEEKIKRIVKNAVYSLHFLAESIVAFYTFLGGK